jgi:Endoplasmic Reticulum-Golgi Intermediate Compartment (ERGIC)
MWFERLAKLDAFPKVDAKYLRQSTPGGLATLLIISAMVILSLFELYRYLVIPYMTSTILMDPQIQHHLFVTMDISVASPCNSLVVELEDVHGGKVSVNALLDAVDIRFLSLNRTASLGHEAGLTTSNSEKTSAAASFMDTMRDLAGETQGSDFAKRYHFGQERKGCRISGTLPIDDVAGKIAISPMIQLKVGFMGFSTNLEGN